MRESRGEQVALLLLSAVTILAWWVVFPVDTVTLGMTNLALESSLYVTAMIATVYVYRLNVSLLGVGWSLFTYSLLLDVLDEFTADLPMLVTTGVGLVRLGGLTVLTVGLYRSQRSLQTDIERRTNRLTVLNRVLRHNVRNWVDIIRMRTELLREGEPVENHAPVIEETAREIGRVTDKVRRFRAAVAQPTDPVDLVGVVEERVRLSSRQFPDVTIETTLPEQAVVQGGALLDIAVDNLLENAVIHNTEPEPRLEIGVAEATDGFVTLTIADNGPGIPEGELAVLEAGTETQLNHGSGLGLWLANWVVTEYDGTLTVENTPDGTVATVRLPAA